MHEIECIMTTYNRTKLLRKTVDSWNSVNYPPTHITVFDDCSTETNEVRAIIKDMRGATLVEGKERLKAYFKTPHSLLQMFKSGAENVFNIDSDTLFNAEWWIRLNILFELVRSTPNFGALTLFDDQNYTSRTIPNSDLPLNTKTRIGAFGTLFTQEYFNNFARKYYEAGRPNWDYRSSEAADFNGMKIYVSKQSLLQHIGIETGSHVGGNPSVAMNFTNETQFIDEDFIRPDIIIPTCKKPEEVAPLIEEIQKYSRGCKLVATCLPKSAAINRNHGLAESTADYVVMCDDDTGGFYDGWYRNLINPLINDKYIVMTSARLIDKEGKPARMVASKYEILDTFEEVVMAPSACIAFRKTDVRFDERFIGCGFEDSWFCHCMSKNGKIVIVNSVRIRHDNEMKNQKDTFQHNHDLYHKLLEEELQ